jgi:hypothetical protein
MQVPDGIDISPMPANDILGLHHFAYWLPSPENGGRHVGAVVEQLASTNGQIVAPWRSGGYVSPLLRCYLISYFLGMLVRYFPSRWMALIRNTEGDAVLPLLRAAADNVESEFPRYLLQALT